MKIQNVLVVHKRTTYEMYVEEERNPRILQLLAESHFTVHDILLWMGAARASLGAPLEPVKRERLRTRACPG